MSDISPQLVRELRDKTNAGMMDCKRALTEAGGDLAKAEDLLRAKGIAWTMVRPTFYMQNFLGCATTIKNEGKFYFPFGEKGATVLIDSRDAGAFMAEVLATDGHENCSYDITCDDLLNFRQVAAIFSEVLGRPVAYVPQDPAAYKARLSQVIKSQWHSDAICDIFAEIAAGYVAQTTDTFARIMKREPVSLRQFIQDHRAVYGN